MQSRQNVSARLLVVGTGFVLVVLFLLWLSARRPHRTSPSPVVAEASAPVAAVPDRATETNRAEASSAVSVDGEWPAVIPIPLAGVLSKPENDPWTTETNWLSLPHGTVILGGIKFQIDGLIQLQSLELDQRGDHFRSEVDVPFPASAVDAAGHTVSPPGSNIASIHLLGASTYSVGNEEKGRAVADVIWHYADGSVRRTAVQHAVHIRDWWRPRYESPTRLPYAGTKVVWRGPNITNPEWTLRLYRITLPNPEPTNVLQRIDFVSAKARPSFFVCALTLDPVVMGLRPDTAADLEEDVDPPLGAKITVTVQDQNGRPISGAQVHASFQEKTRPEGSSGRNEATTDANGSAQVNYPAQNLSQLEIGVFHEDYGGRRMTWNTTAGDSVPPYYTFKIGGGITIGGIVVDTANNPISGASVSAMRFWNGSEALNQRGEQPEFSTQTRSTDEHGVWQVKGVPEGLIDRVLMRVQHPEYIETNVFSRTDAATDRQLREGTFKIVLRRGISVSGWVLDDANHAISNATVWAGSVFNNARKQTQTDAKGRFHFDNVSGGEVPFSALAEGRRPGTKTFTVTNGTDDIVLRLVAGKLIRATVQNQKGEPLPDARVELESPNGGIPETYQFSSSTDSEGHFEWDGAPDEGAPFYFSKTGYEQKRQQWLKPDQDNVVTLRKRRQVQGRVVDAGTGNPIIKFRAGVGSLSDFRPGADRSSDLDRFNPDYPGMRDFADANGTFSLSLEEEQSNAMKVQADDYEALVEKVPDASDGVASMEFQLKPGASLQAIVVAPDRTPVAGATVGFTSGKPGPGRIYLQSGRLQAYVGADIEVTDANGQFKLSSPPPGGMVAAAASQGFGVQPIEAIRSSGQLILQPYGRIEGTFKVAGQPVPGQDFLFSLNNLGIQTDFSSYKVTTDDEGKFTIEKVPPGDGQIVRLVSTAPNSWTHSHATDVSVAPGATTQVTLGDAGAVLVGHVSFQTPPEGETLTVSGNLTTVSSVHPPSFQSPEEARAFFDSPEWKAQMKLMKNYFFVVKADGSFVVDSIAPGVYSLNVTAARPGAQAWNGIPVAQGNLAVTVPDTADPNSPIQLDEIVLKPVTAQSVPTVPH